MIKESREISDLLQCVPFEQHLVKKGRSWWSVKDALAILGGYLQIPSTRMYLACDEDDNILGYMMLSIGGKPLKNTHILRFHASNGDIKKELIDKLEEVLKECNQKTVTIDIRKGVKALKRMFGFKPVSVTMQRGL